METLDQRKQALLRAIVVEYVSHAEPVGSEHLAQKYQLGVRSATVRNELAEMSDMGLLEQPHASAGRIPSDHGYRYFVDHLIVWRKPGHQERNRVRQAAHEGDTLHGLLADTTRALSRLTRMLAAASVVRDATTPVRHAVITALGPDRALLVLVMGNGHVENRLLECPVGLTLEEIGQTNEALAAQLVGKTVRALTQLRPGAGETNVDKMLASALSAARSAAREMAAGTLVIEGEEFMFGQPEFQRDSEAVRMLVESLEDDPSSYELVVRANDAPITIGRENPLEQFHHFSVARRTFYVGEDEAGTIALIGPRRMDYEANLPLLDFTARAISETLTKLLR